MVICQLSKFGIVANLPLVKSEEIDILIGQNLRRLREAQKMSQGMLAEISKTPQTRISAIESGREGMGKDLMTRMCNALKVDPWEFYWTDKTPVIKDKQEQLEIFRHREATMLGVAEEVAKYETFRIDEAKKKEGLGRESASKRVPRSRIKKSA
jgi:transcriptional regulator with XRE-family HTH domain